MRQHQCGTIHLFDDGRHGEGFSGAGYSQQGLLMQSPVYAVGQRFNRLRLVAGGLVFRYQFKMIHFSLLLRQQAVVKAVARLRHGNKIPLRYNNMVNEPYLHSA